MLELRPDARVSPFSELAYVHVLVDGIEYNSSSFFRSVNDPIVIRTDCRDGSLSPGRHKVTAAVEIPGEPLAEKTLPVTIRLTSAPEHAKGTDQNYVASSPAYPSRLSAF